MNEASIIETEKSLNKKLSNIYTIEKEEVKKPRLKVVGIDNYEGMDLKSLEEDINSIVLTYFNKKTNLQSVILEVTSEIYEHIRESKNRIFVGYQNCRVYDDLNVQPCFNCGRFGHNGNKSINDKVCLKCAGTHNSVNCNNKDEICCVNCLYSNNKFNSQYDTKHVANDTTAEIYKHIRKSKNRIFVGYQNCRVYDDLKVQPCFNCGRFGHNGNKCINDKVCLKRAGPHNSVNCNNKASTDYPINPTFQRFIGKIDIYKNTGVGLAGNRQTSASTSSLSPRSSIFANQKRANATSQR
ncbi:hypothetical protein TSAR_000803 [Trichomalopsis sarcophagae]|uniref:CCHC-type domain-containing protein n=1 Tax=Trichomalopsis sarcophagae TaxID=543379 RepID=A0A232FLD0_9HYME|nr:hypothetical protein TSAR_000803 [Trichomalopsis sarcophagae]